jgi:acyl transferase domain-containing protein/NADPH:quinone reductase-like Zn-dependent oxidoreductase/SAM-dependent methyltransferase/NADP-dependent 3-hydroxy acid dehydrogenase YdfG/acyl carrier protein
VVLKRLDDAMQDGDPIRAILRNTGVNQDGKTNGIMVPKSEAQHRLIRQVYHSAGLDPQDTSVVEAHGTGTAVGDVAEITALVQAFGRRKVEEKLYVGSVKANIGHLESASGVAGVIKAVLMLENDMIPATINIRNLKPEITTAESKINIPGVMVRWPDGTSRRLSVNSFGYGGTNAHAILEKASSQTYNLKRCSDSTVQQIFVLSAQSEQSCRSLIGSLKNWISCNEGDPPENLAHTLASRRSKHPWRVALAASSLGALDAGLASCAARLVKPSQAPDTVFVFTGQGAQWYGMGRELLRFKSPFRDSVETSDSILHTLGSTWSLVEELRKDEDVSRINESAISQPATTALQIALFELLGTIGVRPTTVLGHSSGEIAAAYAAGILRHEDAIRIAYFRGRLKPEKKGAMLAVGAGEYEVKLLLPPLQCGKAVVACANSPSSTTLSGDIEAIAYLESLLNSKEIWNRRLKVDRAYHSHHMNTVADQYLRDLCGLRKSAKPSSVKFVSSVTGRLHGECEIEYWVRNLTSKVRFHSAFANALDSIDNENALIIELGPHGALAGPIRQILSQTTSRKRMDSCSILTRNQNAVETFSALVATLFERGSPVDVGKANRLLSTDAKPQVLTSLPPYPWNHEFKYWHESKQSEEHRFRKFPYHDLLGLLVPGGDMDRPVWRHVLDIRALPWLRDHVIHGELMFPASAFMSMVIEAVRQYASIRANVDNPETFELKDVQFLAALALPEIRKTTTLFLHLEPDSDSGWAGFRLTTASDRGTSVVHCCGRVRYQRPKLQYYQWHDGLPTVDSSGLAALPDPYGELRSQGNTYGPQFALMSDLRTDPSRAFCTIRVPDLKEYMTGSTLQPHVLHPTTWDAMMHPSVAIFSRHYNGAAIVIQSVKSLILKPSILSTPDWSFNVCTSVRETWPHNCCTDISVYQTTGSHSPSELVLKQEGIVFRALSSHKSWLGRRDMTYQLCWGLDVDLVKPQHVLSTNRATAAEDLMQAAKLDALNRASTVYIQKCLQALDKAEVPSIEYHRWLLDWMRRFARTEEFRDLRGTSAAGEVLKTVSQFGVEGEVLSRIGDHLADILIAKIDPLSLITDEDLLWRLYADDASTRCYGHLIEFLRHLIFKQPTMDVLEIGAGTGGATGPMLTALSDCEASPFKSYVFSDISTAFFERARARLNKWSDNISFAKLDIEQDTAGQGFENGSFDVIVASNVLHVSTSIDGALSRIKRLLKPGGRLALIETVKNVPFYNTCLGTLPGWWAGCDDGRPDGPFLSVAEWDAAFVRNGLGGVAVSARDFDNTAHRCAFLVSQPLDEKKSSVKPPVPVQVRCCPDWPKSLGDRAFEVLSKRSGLGLEQESFFDVVNDEANIIVLDDGSSQILTGLGNVCFRQAMDILSKAAKVIWISLPEVLHGQKESTNALISGFARVARVENASLRLVTLDIKEEVFDAKGSAAFSEGFAKFLELVFLRNTLEEEFAYESGIFSVPRILPSNQVNEAVARTLRQLPSEQQPLHQAGRTLRLSTSRPSATSDPKFEEDDRLKGPVAPDEVEIQVQACGVTYDDARIMSGNASNGDSMVGEFSGTVEKYGAKCEGVWAVGDRVCGFGATPYASRIRISRSAIARMTQDMSFALAAALPFDFTTAWYALIDVAALEPGQTVLVHGATSTVGQAVVAVARYRGSAVYAIVESDDQHGTYLIEAVHQVGPRDFAQSNRPELCSGGYDVVVNASRRPAPNDLVDLVAELGTYVDITHTRKTSDVPLLAKEGVRYAFPNTIKLRQKKPAKVSAILSKLLSLVEGGHLGAPSVSRRPISELKDAFSDAFRRSGGVAQQKVVVTAGTDAKIHGPPFEPTPVRLSSDGTYVIAGGLGGLGYEIAKLFAQYGAGYVVLLTRRTPSAMDIASIKADFTELSTDVKVVSSDITKLEDLSERLSDATRCLPPVRGVVQCAMVLRDRVISQMTLQDFTEGIAPKVTGTQNLLKILDKRPLDFCLMLSSIVGSIVGTIAEGSYAAGNAFQSHLSRTQYQSGPRMITLSPGAIDDVGVLSKDTVTTSILERQGLPAVSSKHVLALIEYALGVGMKERGNIEIVSGLDYQSLETANSSLLHKPMFSHLLRNKRKVREIDHAASASQVKQATLEQAKSFEEAEQIILGALKSKIASLVAVSGDIDSTRSMSELGADSLVLIELKNWINQTFRTKITTSDIADSRSAMSLVQQIALQCPIIPTPKPAGQPPVITESLLEKSATVVHRRNNSNHTDTLPKLPLPDLDSSLQYWLKAIHATLSQSDYSRAQQMAEDFRAPGGIGQKLQSRLTALNTDPTIDSWQEKLYYRNQHMKPRVPLVPHRCFYGTHCQGSSPHSQAERAAIVALACLNFKTQVEAGLVEREVVNEQVLDAVQFEFLFNTSREPKMDEDAMVRHPSSEHIIIFRRGNAFKISLVEQGDVLAFQTLRSLFEQMLGKEDLTESWVGILTADTRNEWAQNRSVLRDLSDDNSIWLHAIETAAFTINLDEASPAGPSERGQLFLHANGFNRWSDKPIQFTITRNGYSAAIGEHSMIDGYTMRRVNASMNEAIRNYRPDTNASSTRNHQSALQNFAFQTNPVLDTEIRRVQQRLQETTSIHESTSFEVSAVDFDFFRNYKLAPKAAIQVAVQSACRRFYGASHMAHEPVSVNHFSKGRVDICQILWAEVKDFCDAACSSDRDPSTLHHLFINATNAHASNVMRCSRGQGSDRHLLCLEWLLEDGEEKPDLFASPIYRASRPRMIMTENLETGFLEVGSWPSSAKGLWIHFEPGESAVRFSIWGPIGTLGAFSVQLKHSLELTRRILEAGGGT